MVYRHKRVQRNSGRWAWVLAALVLIVSGIAYQVMAARMRSFFAAAGKQLAPFSAMPMNIGDWVGTELSIPLTTREYMERNFADDYVSRRYVNSRPGTWADVYVVYCSSRPGGILGHRPGVCYPNSGWAADSTEESEITTGLGRRVPCLIHRFHKPSSLQETVVLNFYVVNGTVTTSERGFSGLLDKRPNIEGNPARYVAQVQISSIVENSIRQAAADMTDTIMDFLPDANGQVRAAEVYGPKQNLNK